MVAIDALRTPETRFGNLPDFPWSPKYIEDLPGFDFLMYEDGGGAVAQMARACGQRFCK